ncbi:DinB family protein [Kribbella sp. NBC_01245]|uniref:mycothiol transferase n=1 Tax=Kribbella sp. NBC_01245 TaxID=2903578 RepID=UPI002E2D5E31|nr:DinB family protein [Kribbella sp. NBC_01245]
MNTCEVLVDAFGRIQEEVHSVVGGLGPDQLADRPHGKGNSIAWLIWHLTRIQDDHVADVAGTTQVYVDQGWTERLGLPFDAADTGYGHTDADVEAVRVTDGSLLTGYYDAVHATTIEYLQGLKDDDFDRIVDTRWDPPVTLGARLVSVISDDLQHVGQAAHVRGLL